MPQSAPQVKAELVALGLALAVTAQAPSAVLRARGRGLEAVGVALAVAAELVGRAGAAVLRAGVGALAAAGLAEAVAADAHVAAVVGAVVRRLAALGERTRHQPHHVLGGQTPQSCGQVPLFSPQLGWQTLLPHWQEEPQSVGRKVSSLHSSWHTPLPQRHELDPGDSSWPAPLTSQTRLPHWHEALHCLLSGLHTEALRAAVGADASIPCRTRQPGCRARTCPACGPVGAGVGAAVTGASGAASTSAAAAFAGQRDQRGAAAAGEEDREERRPHKPEAEDGKGFTSKQHDKHLGGSYSRFCRSRRRRRGCALESDAAPGKLGPSESATVTARWVARCHSRRAPMAGARLARNEGRQRARRSMTSTLPRLAPSSRAWLSDRPSWCVDMGSTLLAMTTCDLWLSLARNDVTPRTKVWREGMPYWEALEKVPEFALAMPDATVWGTGETASAAAKVAVEMSTGTSGRGAPWGASPRRRA